MNMSILFYTVIQYSLFFPTPYLLSIVPKTTKNTNSIFFLNLVAAVQDNYFGKPVISALCNYSDSLHDTRKISSQTGIEAIRSIALLRVLLQSAVEISHGNITHNSLKALILDFTAYCEFCRNANVVLDGQKLLYNKYLNPEYQLYYAGKYLMD